MFESLPISIPNPVYGLIQSHQLLSVGGGSVTHSFLYFWQHFYMKILNHIIENDISQVLEIGSIGDLTDLISKCAAYKKTN